MATDLMLLTLYLIVVLLSKPERRFTAFVVTGWFFLSVVVFKLGLVASITFPIWWAMAGITCIILALRGSAIVLVGMSAMFLLQMSLTIDAWLTNQSTPLYLNYGTLALMLNLVIMFLTFLHGRGLESVDNTILDDHSHHHNIGH